MSLCLKKEIIDLVVAQRRSKKLKDVEWLLQSNTGLAAGKGDEGRSGIVVAWKKCIRIDYSFPLPV